MQTTEIFSAVPPAFLTEFRFLTFKHITQQTYTSVLTSMMGASGGTSLFGWSSSGFLPFFTTRGRWSSPSICSLAGDGGSGMRQSTDIRGQSHRLVVSPAPSVAPTRLRAVHRPVVPVRSFMTVVIGDVKVIHLPRALVVGHVSPLDQVMDVSVFVETAAREQRSVWSSSLRFKGEQFLQQCEVLSRATGNVETLTRIKSDFLFSMTSSRG